MDAVLGVATLGQGTRLAAAGRTAAAEGASLFRRGFDLRSQLLDYIRRAPQGMQWHDIVEKSQIPHLLERRIQTFDDVLHLSIEAHQSLSAFYSSKVKGSSPYTVRQWLRKQSFEEQYAFGMSQIERVLGY